MIGNSNKDFLDVVSVGEMIEAGVKQGKIESVEAKKPIPKRKEGETHTVLYQKRACNPSYPSQQNYDFNPITSVVKMSRKEIINHTPDPWQDSLCYLRQHR